MRQSLMTTFLACATAAFLGTSAGAAAAADTSMDSINADLNQTPPAVPHDPHDPHDPPTETPTNPIAEPGGPPPGVAGHMGGARGDTPDFPPTQTIIKDYSRIDSAGDGARSFYTLWTRSKDAQVLLELPRNFEGQKLFIAYTIAGGIETAGVQAGNLYAYWKRYDKRLALIEPNYAVRTTGDLESRRGHDRVFTDRIVLDVPILGMGPGGGPIIDGDALLAGRASQFFGGRTFGANASLAKIAKAKAFPRNIELAFELPLNGGRLGTLHYSISELPGSRGYRPRVADARVGYFTTTFRDIGHPDRETPYIRYANRWNLEKRDSRLSKSPPKQPIIFYLEHTIPVRYRRWVREGVLEWNKAFEKVGILDAIEVYQQDAQTGAYMDIDPEDARYNFILWTNANMGFAIGPSRVHPETGEILDADVVMDEGFISSWVRAYEGLMPEIAMQHADPQTLAWFATRPQWDPRVRLARPAQRQQVLQQLAIDRAEQFGMPFAGHDVARIDSTLIGDNRFDGLAGRLSQVNGACECARHAGLELAMLRMSDELLHELSIPKTDSDSETRNAILNDPVSGTWEGEAEAPDHTISFVMELQLLDDGIVTGTINAMMFMGDVTGTFDAETKKLTMRMAIPDGPVVEFDLTIDNDTMTGTATAEGEAIPVNGRRTAKAPAVDDPEPAVDDDAGTDVAPAGDDDKEGGEDEADDADDARKADEADDEKEKPAARAKPVREYEEGMLDGVPEEFIGPLLKSIVMHEVGHTLGLRHNFKASTIYSLEEINNAKHGDKTITGSVMDYIPININYKLGNMQGAYAMTTIGPYDYWAIEYGYGEEKDLKKVLKRVAEPELAFGTDEDSWGSDPRIVTFDLGENPLEYADMQMELVQHLRGEILERIVKEGDNWAKARLAYEMLLSRHLQAVSIAANWIGGSETYRDLKGDPGDRPSVVPMSAEQQRRAFKFVMDNTFNEEAFGLTPELLSRMTVEKWWDEDNMVSLFDDPAWPVHERVLGVQASALSMMLNPSTLARVYDNELRVADGDDAITLPEIINGVADEIWKDLDATPGRSVSARNPMISSLRRNLQREHLDRMIDLTLPNGMFGVAQMPVSTLAVFKLRTINGRIEAAIKKHGSKIDPYTIAHLSEASEQITRALDAQYIYNTDDISSGGGGLPLLLFGQEGAPAKR
jgi:hypothetical protein